MNVSPATSTIYNAIGRPPSSSGGSQVTLRAKEVKPVSVTACGAVGAVGGNNQEVKGESTVHSSHQCFILRGGGGGAGIPPPPQ